MAADIKAEILNNPSLGVNLGKGKSGGARVITITVVAAVDETEINLLYIYDKAERSNITDVEIKALLKECGFL